MRLFVALLVALLVATQTVAAVRPTSCLEGAETLVGEGGALCAAPCALRWQAQIDWAANEVLVFNVELAGRCLGVPDHTAAYCFADGAQTTLAFLASFVRVEGMATASARWTYDGGVDCDALLANLSAAAALRRSFVVETMLTDVMLTLAEEEAPPAPLAAFAIACPLLADGFECRCHVGCTYTLEHWRDTAHELDGPRILGLSRAAWLAGSAQTHECVPAVRAVLAQYLAATLNSELFGCTVPADESTSDAEARRAVETRLIAAAPNVSAAECTHATAASWQAHIDALTAWNAGRAGPCACTELACAARFPDVPALHADGAGTAVAIPRPFGWSTWTMVFLVLAVVGWLVVAVCCCCCLYTWARAMIGSRGLVNLGADMNRDQGEVLLVNG